MSLMSDAIEQIGIAMERRKSRHLAQDFLSEGIYSLEEFRQKPNNIKHTATNFDRLTLSIENINITAKDYPYHLPDEVLELYKLANGCFPIGSRNDIRKDWESPEFYCSLGDSGIPVQTEEGLDFLSLKDAIALYDHMSGYGHDPHFLPIFTFSEYLTYGIMGDEAPLVSSPLIEVSLEGNPTYK